MSRSRAILARAAGGAVSRAFLSAMNTVIPHTAIHNALRVCRQSQATMERLQKATGFQSPLVRLPQMERAFRVARAWQGLHRPQRWEAWLAAVLDALQSAPRLCHRRPAARAGSDRDRPRELPSSPLGHFSPGGREAGR